MSPRPIRVGIHLRVGKDDGSQETDDQLIQLREFCEWWEGDRGRRLSRRLRTCPKRSGGKFYRKARPGSWKEDLTPRRVEIVERITAPLLEEFYPD